MNKIIFLLIMFWIQNVSASPFLVSSPSKEMIGGSFEVVDTSTNNLVLSQNTEYDGSIKLDVGNIEIGLHTYKIRYFRTEPSSIKSYGEFTSFSLKKGSQSIRVFNAKTYNGYLTTKSWYLKVPK